MALKLANMCMQRLLCGLMAKAMLKARSACAVASLMRSAWLLSTSRRGALSHISWKSAACAPTARIVWVRASCSAFSKPRRVIVLLTPVPLRDSPKRRDVKMMNEMSSGAPSRSARMRWPIDRSGCPAYTWEGEERGGGVAEQHRYGTRHPKRTW